MAPRRRTTDKQLNKRWYDGWIDKSDIIIKVLILVGVVFNLYLKAGFVDIEQYKKDREVWDTKVITYQQAAESKFNKIETAIMLMQEQNKRNEDQDKVLADHESRLRVLERQPLTK